ncbi:MAG: DUF1465 family protein [Sphingomonadales bacterium]|nr:DUF1465 family protein [Sphingomonadales bacterium]MDE2568256.1 DUF1465 family protein [Sphingomonadales bacterium]
MALMPSINPRIVEALYAEALVLADEVRHHFDQARRHAGPADTADEDLARVALSCEALRTTTRVMHCLAWLLNHRAYFSGQLTELQLRRHGRLFTNMAESEPGNMAMLPPEVRQLVSDSERLYQRIQRLETAWRGETPGGATAIERLRQRLAASVGG